MSRVERNTHSRHHPRKRVIQYSRVTGDYSNGRGLLDTPLSRGMTANFGRVNCATPLVPPSSDTPDGPRSYIPADARPIHWLRHRWRGRQTPAPASASLL